MAVNALAKDVSNYSDPLNADLLAAWMADGTRLVIIQCFPPNYAQYTQQRAQMSTCAAAGMPFDVYIYDYLGAPDWLSGALDGLDQVLLPSEKPRMVWLDEEDTETEAGWTTAARVSAISSSIGNVQQHGYRCGIYTAAWWWTPKIGGFNGFSDYPLWAAQYDGIADASVFTPFGNWAECHIKQYAGSQPDGTDLDVLSATEAFLLTQPTDDPRADDPRDARIKDLLTTISVMSGDVADSLANTGAVLHKQAAAKRMTRAQIAGSATNVDAVVAELKRLRAAAS